MSLDVEREKGTSNTFDFFFFFICAYTRARDEIGPFLLIKFRKRLLLVNDATPVSEKARSYFHLSIRVFSQLYFDQNWINEFENTFFAPLLDHLVMFSSSRYHPLLDQVNYQ